MDQRVLDQNVSSAVDARCRLTRNGSTKLCNAFSTHHLQNSARFEKALQLSGNRERVPGTRTPMMQRVPRINECGTRTQKSVYKCDNHQRRHIDKKNRAVCDENIKKLKRGVNLPNYPES